MKTHIILFLAVVTLLSCQRRKQSTDQPAKETPKALQETRSDVESFISKRGANDLVDELYDGLVNENAQLKDIETLLKKTYEEKVDLIDKYNSFDQKSNRYYSDAERHYSNMKDSSLRKKIIAIIKTSCSKYGTHVNHLSSLVKTIEAGNGSIDDYHAALKIVVTLPLIESFQRDNLPKDSSYKAIIKKQSDLIRKMDNTMKK